MNCATIWAFAVTDTSCSGLTPDGVLTFFRLKLKGFGFMALAPWVVGATIDVATAGLPEELRADLVNLARRLPSPRARPLLRRRARSERPRAHRPRPIGEVPWTWDRKILQVRAHPTELSISDDLQSNRDCIRRVRAHRP